MRATIAVVLGLVLMMPVSAQEPKDDEIPRLVEQLGDAKFQNREDAGRRLRQMGRAAIPALSAAITAPQAEVRKRADDILTDIDPIWRNAKAVRSTDVKIRREAIRNIVGYRDPRVLDLVLAQLREEADRDCLNVLLEFVAHLGDRRATPALTDALLKPTNVQGYEVERVLRAIAMTADPAIIPALRKYCAQHLTAKPKANDKAFEKYWNIQGVGLNVALAGALGALADPDGAEPISLMLSVSYDGHGGGVVQRAAVAALVKIGPKAVPVLTRQWEQFQGKYGPQIGTRLLVVEALGRIGDDKAIPILERALDDPQIPGYAAVALDRIGSDKGAKWILAQLSPAAGSTPRSETVREALDALKHCKHPSLKQLCEKILKNGQAWQRWSAAEALARMGEKSGLAFFHEQLKEEHSLHWAVEPLVELRDTTCVPALIRWSKHEGQIAVQASVPALARIATPEAVKRLIEMANGPEKSHGYARTKTDAIRAPALVRTRPSVEALMALLDDGNPEVQGLAVGSLCEIVGVRIEGVARWKTWWDYHKASFLRK